jgi:hypothetical protein
VHGGDPVLAESGYDAGVGAVDVADCDVVHLDLLLAKKPALILAAEH